MKPLSRRTLLRGTGAALATGANASTGAAIAAATHAMRGITVIPGSRPWQFPASQRGAPLR